MNYKDTLAYMYHLLPMYQRVGAQAFKKDLTNTIKLCKLLGDPHKKIKTIHIAGTNGKGSSAHMLASILQAAGYKTGLYTSPHLVSFTERIKVNGQEVEESFVVDFINRIDDHIKRIQPSFFELTVAMAFDYFEQQSVDVAVIEVGLGGRLDSTNVLTPLISLITTIGLDHTDMLGNTLPEIAFEKAGIIKHHVPVVISETQEDIKHVFMAKASEMKAPIYFADQEFSLTTDPGSGEGLHFRAQWADQIFKGKCDLSGEYQLKNLPGVLKVVDLLSSEHFKISESQLGEGLSNVRSNTGLFGRWQKIKDMPLTICDTAHNEAGVRLIMQQIEKMAYRRLFIIWGAVDGKNIDEVFSILPTDATYYFCQPNVPRALDAKKLKQIATKFDIAGEIVRDVNKAIEMVYESAESEDLVIIAGSNFVIAEIENLKG